MAKKTGKVGKGMDFTEPKNMKGLKKRAAAPGQVKKQPSLPWFGMGQDKKKKK